MNPVLNIYSNTIIIIVIALLSCLTINRGIYLYFNSRYKDIDMRLKEHREKYGYTSLYPVINLKTNFETTNSDLDETKKEEKKKIYDLIKQDEKQLNILHYRFQLGISVILLVLSIIIKKTQIKFGLMLGAFINIFFTSIRSWSHINEGEKFSVTAGSLAVVIAFVIKFCK